MSLNIYKTRLLNVQTLRGLQKCCYATKPKNMEGIEVEEVPVYDVEPKYTMEELDKIRNKSRLESNHRNILLNKAPYEEAKNYHHDQIMYRRKVLGTYGMNATMANPKYCWPTKEEVEDIKEYEKCLYPKTIQEVWKDIEEKKKQDALEIINREKEIDKVVANFDKWQDTLELKMKKKEAELLAAKQRKEALLEEIRDHFGFQIDTKDERFQEMLEQKEKEDKKKKKEAKKQERKEKMLAFIAEQAKKSLPNEATVGPKKVSKKEEKSGEEKSSEEKSEKTN